MTRLFLYLLALCLVLTCLNTSTFAAPQTLNLLDFGATGDGNTDDAPAFQKAVTAEVEDAAQVHYPLRVEFVSPLPELPQVSQIVLRLSRELDDQGEVLLFVTVHGRTSN